MQRLNSSKNIVIIDEIEDRSYDNAINTCKRICGNLYFPSTLAENNEVDKISGYEKYDGNPKNHIWIRIFYNSTDKKWYDADNKGDGITVIIGFSHSFNNSTPYYKENLTFLNFHPGDYTDPRVDHHAAMEPSGLWWSDTFYPGKQFVSYFTAHNVICELTQ